MMSLHIDGQLNDVELLNFKKHIHTCEQCREELEFLQSIVEACNNLEEVELPVDFKQQLHQKLVQTQQDVKHSTPPWYLNWRMYSGLVAGILLVLAMKFQIFGSIFDSIYKPEKAYVSEAKLEYSASKAAEIAKEEPKKEEKKLEAESAVREEEEVLTDAAKPDQPLSIKAFSASQEKVQAKEEAQKSSAAGAAEPAVPPAQEPKADGTRQSPENKSLDINISVKKDQVCRGLYRDRKPLIAYKAIVKLTQENAALLWEKIQDKLAEYEGQYTVLYKDGKPVIRASKEKYDEMLEYIQKTSIEFKLDYIEVDETDKYQTLIAQCDSISKKIEELQAKLKSAAKQEEMDSINEQLQVMLDQQQQLINNITDLEDSIGKCSIELEITS